MRWAGVDDDTAPDDGLDDRQLVAGSSFVLDAPSTVPALFGVGQSVAWAEGEPLLVVGPQGVGKTTLIQQLALRRAGVRVGELIGLPVRPDLDATTLYLAADRPRQIARSFRRMVTDADRPQLDRLAIWKGPLPFNLVREPERLVAFIAEIAERLQRPIGTVFIDSLKDIAAPLSSDEVGSAVNRAIGGLIAADIEVCSSHHQRKATAENKRPTTLADVYGSVWLTAGAGSVLLLWGDAGDPIVSVTHVKQPAEDIGPFEILHDHATGTTTRCEQRDASTILQAVGTATVTEIAQRLYPEDPTRAQIEKVRRKLDGHVKAGRATRQDATAPGDPTTYTVTPVTPVTPPPPPPHVTPHATVTTLTKPLHH